MRPLQFHTISQSSIKDKIYRIKQRGQILFSNYFGSNEECCLEAYETENSILIRRKEYDFYRLYVVSTDEGELKQLLTQSAENNYSINIPSKCSIEQWDNLLTTCNFVLYAEYHRFFINKTIKYRNSAIGDYATQNDLADILKLSNDTFDKYTDYIPSKNELQDMIANKQALVSKDSIGAACGVLLFCIEGKKMYLRMWVDKGNTGLFLLYKVYNIAFEKGINYVYFWVNATNKEVIRLHTLMGAKEDGLKDYTYIHTFNTLNI